MACEEYKKTKSSTKLVSKANKIYKEFIDTQAPREVCVHVCMVLRVFPCKTGSVISAGKYWSSNQREDQAKPGGSVPDQPQRSASKNLQPDGERLLPTIPQVQDVPGYGQQGTRTRPAQICLSQSDEDRWMLWKRWATLLAVVSVCTGSHMQSLDKRCVLMSQDKLTYIHWWLKWLERLTDLKYRPLFASKTPFHFMMLLRMVPQREMWVLLVLFTLNLNIWFTHLCNSTSI